MSAERDVGAEAVRGPVAVSTEVREGWRYLMGGGVLIAILGIIAVFTPYVTGIVLSLLLGAILVAGGFVHVAHAFRATHWTGALWQIVLALVYGVVGIALLANPVIGLTTLTILLIAFLFVEGVVELLMGFQIRPEPRWGWMVASGVISLVLGGLLLLGFPSTAAWALGLLVGLSLLSTGISMMSVAYVGRRAMREIEGREAGSTS